MTKLIVLGWDSATFDVAGPLMEEGRLPALKRLCDEGFSAPLRSTWPPMTDSAWTSAFTGRNPGGHGIFGSWYRAPGSYSCRYFSSRDRRAPALWEMTEDVRHLVWNVPMTFPPTSVPGAMVAGYGAPTGATFCDPPGLQQTLADRWALDDLLDRAPYGSLEQFFVDLLRGLEAQAEAVPYAIKKTRADCAAVVWPHIDRAQHFFWRFRGTDHALGTAVDNIYEAMDRATAAIVEAFPDATVVVVSDHGAGELKGDVNLGPWLAQNGYAVQARSSGSPLVKLAWAMPPPVRRLAKRIAPGAARKTFAATLAGQLGPFDWTQTKAFLGFHGDLWVNVEGREPQGCVPESEVDGLLDELSSDLLALRDPSSGESVFGGVHRRAEIYSGPAASLGCDLMLDTWSQGYRVAPKREGDGSVVIEPSPLAGVDAAWSSDHRPLGIFAAAGGPIAQGSADELSLMDVTPVALALLGSSIPAGLDGRARPELFESSWLASNPLREGAAAGERSAEAGYSESEAEAVAAHLKDLGYIE